jgi:WD40 repeat protein
MTVLGHGTITSRYTAEVWAHGDHAYTTTWGTRFAGGAGLSGNTIYIWSVTGATPVLLDSVAVADVNTLGDVQVTPDGRYLVVPTERDPGSIITYDLSDPVKPQELSRFTSPKITRGVHTCEIQSVNGRLYAFLAVNGGQHPPRLMIVDLSDPSNPTEVFTRDISGTFIHDVFVRDGILFSAEWNNGMVIPRPVQRSAALCVRGRRGAGDPLHWIVRRPPRGGRQRPQCAARSRVPSRDRCRCTQLQHG